MTSMWKTLVKVFQHCSSSCISFQGQKLWKLCICTKLLSWNSNIYFLIFELILCCLIWLIISQCGSSTAHNSCTYNAFKYHFINLKFIWLTPASIQNPDHSAGSLVTIMITFWLQVKGIWEEQIERHCYKLVLIFNIVQHAVSLQTIHFKNMLGHNDSTLFQV